MEKQKGSIQGLAKECGIRMLRAYVAGYVSGLNKHKVKLSRIRLYAEIGLSVAGYIRGINLAIDKDITFIEEQNLLRELKEYARDVYNVV